MKAHLRAVLSWGRRKPVLAAVICVSLGFVALNVVAFQHARAMIWFVDGGSRTPRPQMLSILGKCHVLLTGVRVPRPANEQLPSDVGLAFSTHTIQVNPRVTLEAWLIPVEGAKGTTILFHGYASSKSDLLPEAVAFHEQGLQVWLVDFRGSGGSSERYTTVGYLEAEDVAAAFKFIQAASRRQPTILFGRSMGGAAILRAISVHQIDPDAVILESVFDRMSTTAANRFHQMGLPSFPGANLLLFWGGVCAGIKSTQHNPVDYAGQCRCPTLLLHGEVDPNAQLSEAQNVQSHMGDRDCQLVIFPNVGHVPIRQADPSRWDATVDRFMSDRVLDQSMGTAAH